MISDNPNLSLKQTGKRKKIERNEIGQKMKQLNCPSKYFSSQKIVHNHGKNYAIEKNFFFIIENDSFDEYEI